MSTDPTPETRYRKLPIEVDARQLLGSDDGEAGRELAAWCGGWLAGTYREPKLIVPTLEGDMAARVGDWIVKGVRGEFHPVRGDIFAETYEPAAPDQTLRDRVADALAEVDGWKWAPGFKATSPAWLGYQQRADAVLAVLPTDGRAGALLEAETRLRARAAELVAAADADPLAEVKRGTDARRHSAECWNAAAEELRRLAVGERDEQQAQQDGAETRGLSGVVVVNGVTYQAGPCGKAEPHWPHRGFADGPVCPGVPEAAAATPAAASTPRANENDGTVAETGGALLRAHVALAEQAGRDQAALARVRQLHDRLAEETDPASPDDSITRGAAAKRIATALDGWSPELRPARGDQFEAWLKTQRDTFGWHGANDRRLYDALGSVLDTYRLHADTGTPLDQHACEGPHCDCPPAAAPVAGQPQADAGEEAREEIECANCWRVVENRSVPNMGGPSHDNWVHVPGGFQPCFPQRGADSPRAEPELTVAPQPETVHACPPDGSGLTPCCGRTPFELPLTDRISSEVPATCTGPTQPAT